MRTKLKLTLLPPLLLTLTACAGSLDGAVDGLLTRLGLGEPEVAYDPAAAACRSFKKIPITRASRKNDSLELLAGATIHNAVWDKTCAGKPELFYSLPPEVRSPPVP